MTNLGDNVSRAFVELDTAAYRRMVELVKLLDRLWNDRCYREQVYAEVREVARFDPGHASAMMCYDFHVCEDVPRLIEVNTNAGGALLACMACEPSLLEAGPVFPPKVQQPLLDMFAAEMSGFTNGRMEKPGFIAIIDENPKGQHLYPEMRAFAKLLDSWGVTTEVVDPGELKISSGKISLAGQPVDMIYNRHCDFYLETAAMSAIREAYLAGNVCLSPNPHMYGLLADKRRMVLWSNPQKPEGWSLNAEDQALLDIVLPDSTLLSSHQAENLWPGRKRYAFKPVDSFGSRGVLLGAKITRKRFDELDPQTTLVQELVPPSMTKVQDHGPMKTDFRLYAYRDTVLGITARLYRGQVTNLRTQGGGFARIKLV